MLAESSTTHVRHLVPSKWSTVTWAWRSRWVFSKNYHPPGSPLHPRSVALSFLQNKPSVTCFGITRKRTARIRENQAYDFEIRLLFRAQNMVLLTKLAVQVAEGREWYQTQGFFMLHKLTSNSFSSLHGVFVMCVCACVGSGSRSVPRAQLSRSKNHSTDFDTIEDDPAHFARRRCHRSCKDGIRKNCCICSGACSQLFRSWTYKWFLCAYSHWSILSVGLVSEY